MHFYDLVFPNPLVIFLYSIRVLPLVVFLLRELNFAHYYLQHSTVKLPLFVKYIKFLSMEIKKNKSRNCYRNMYFVSILHFYVEMYRAETILITLIES